MDQEVDGSVCPKESLKTCKIREREKRSESVREEGRRVCQKWGGRGRGRSGPIKTNSKVEFETQKTPRLRGMKPTESMEGCTRTAVRTGSRNPNVLTPKHESV